MLTLQEVLQKIEASILKRDFRHEHTPANSQLMKQWGEGTFEAVLTGQGEEKYLIPESGTLHYLYRGQNTEYIPCLPTLYRNNPPPEEIFLNRMRLVSFKRLIQTHPVVEHFFQRHHFSLDEEGLAQHYGLNTSVLDLTSNIDIAMFFAVCKYDKVTDTYDYYKDEETHDAILYVFDPAFDNEPTPGHNLLSGYLSHNITPIGLQPFLRPAVQYGYALHIKEGCSTKSWAYRFTFTSKDSKYYYDKFHKGETLWIRDELIAKTKPIIDKTTFSYRLFNETYNLFRPKGFSREKLKIALKRIGVTFLTKEVPLCFTKAERAEIISKWNNELAPQLATKIVRKPWFEHEGIDKVTNKIIGRKNENSYRTLNLIASEQLLTLVGAPKGPIDAEWINYTNTPRPQLRRIPKDDGVCMKIPATMINIFGKTYLQEADWRILTTNC